MPVTRTRLRAAAGAFAATIAGGAGAALAADFGEFVENALRAQSLPLFGVNEPLAESAPATAGAYRTPAQTAADQVALADGLSARYLTRNAANATDMIAFWPSDENPTHLITCIEGGRSKIASNQADYPDTDADADADPGDKLNPSVQRISLTTGDVATILRGMTACDGIHTTPWGTILATEETTTGGAYEIIQPLTTTNVTVVSRGAQGQPASFFGAHAANVVKRTALPAMSWEGLAVLPSGVVIAGDELRPGSSYNDANGNPAGGANADGGAIFKFVPTVPHAGGPIASLAQSPLVAGSVYALQVSCTTGTQYGQGCEIGNAAWVPVSAANARADANAAGATGYYRPEDLHDDPMYEGPGVRFCWTNTGNEGAKNYAEVICGIDSDPMTANAGQRTVVVNRFVEGDTDFNSFDNLAFQPNTGNLYVIEDHGNGDIFACLPDGADRDIKTDGCVKILSVKDSSAEPTGFIFDASGTVAYVSIQHTNDELMPMHDHYRTDDVLVITGFKAKNVGNK
jgi:hypothetical protein